MTNTLDNLIDNLGNSMDPGVTAISEVKGQPGRNGVPSATECVKCGLPLPKEGEPFYQVQRKYHNECRPYTAPKAKVKAKVTPGNDDPAPKSVTNNFKVTIPKANPKLETEMQAVEESATFMLGFIPMALAGFGDEVCPQALVAAIPAIAHQLALLSKYHPVIRKIFVSGEGTGEAMAWVGLAIAVSPAIIAILSHHNLLKGAAAQRLEAVAGLMGGLSGNVE
jgi:hypothetical protein